MSGRPHGRYLMTTDCDSIPEENNSVANKTVYSWGWCNLCQVPFVRCPGCGNNTCNSGGDCDECDAAHEHWNKTRWPTGDELQRLKDEEQAEFEKACAENPNDVEFIKLFSGRNRA